jgi:hypothetical protein
MDPAQIERKKREIVERCGPWTAHSIRLADGVDTFDEAHWDTRLRRFIQIAADLSKKPVPELRVLDLACLEGAYGIEFALQGARVVAIEGREANLEKVRFAKEVLGLAHLDPVLDDVRSLSPETYGTFDVVLCLGILYHLDAPDVMEFLRRVADVCTGVAIIDTHFALEGDLSFDWGRKTYWGTSIPEHHPDLMADEKVDAKWSSLDNVRSFWLTKASLCNLLSHVGFTSVFECLTPYEFHNADWPRNPDGGRHVVWEDRTTFVAVRGQQRPLITSPMTEALPEEDRPEHPDGFAGHKNLPGKSNGAPRRPRSLRSMVSGFVPGPVKRILRRVVPKT